MDAITHSVSCPECGTRYQLKTEQLGARVRCHRCHQVWRAEAPESLKELTADLELGLPDDQPSTAASDAASRSGPPAKSRRWRPAIALIALLSIAAAGLAVAAFPHRAAPLLFAGLVGSAASERDDASVPWLDKLEAAWDEDAHGRNLRLTGTLSGHAPQKGDAVLAVGFLAADGALVDERHLAVDLADAAHAGRFDVKLDSVPESAAGLRAALEPLP